MNIYEKLMNIQAELKAPKNQFNSFGKYNYRSTEDILEGLKPLLLKYKVALLIGDEIEAIGEHSPLLYKEEVYDSKSKATKEETRVTGSQRYYVKATAILFDIEKDGKVTTTAYAREDETKKGMDLAQVTGSTSSYARKYALNGLFAIDDTKDSDSTNTATKGNETPPATKPTSNLSDAQIKRLYAIGKTAGYDTDTVNSQLKVRFNKKVDELTRLEYDTVCKGYEGLKK